MARSGGTGRRIAPRLHHPRRDATAARACGERRRAHLGDLARQPRRSPNADPAVVELFDQFRARNDFGQGNFQFKNKFRPTSQCLYLCRPRGLDATTALNVLTLIADPPNQGEPSPEPKPTNAVMAPPVVAEPAAAEPPAILASCGYNPGVVAPDQVPYDLRTDSWAELDNAVIRARIRRLEEGFGPAPDLLPTLAGIFPQRHLIPVSSGRQAEAYLAAALRETLPKGRTVVPQNGLFPTWIYHQIDQGFQPRSSSRAGASSR